MKLQDYLDQLSTIEKEKITTLLTFLENINSFWKNLVQNCFLESSLDRDDWDKIFNILLKTQRNHDQFIVAFQKFSRNRRQLIGDPATLPSNTILGRIRSFKKYCQDLVDLKYYNDIDEAKADVRSKIGVDPRKVNSEWREQEISKYNIWSTFDPLGGKPFENPSSITAAEIICSLGIEPIKGLVIIFIYILPSTIQVTVPTICDAYAGDPLPRFFHRVPAGSPYGMTQPTEDCIVREGRPEVVHSTIKAKLLIYPLRYA